MGIEYFHDISENFNDLSASRYCTHHNFVCVCASAHSIACQFANKPPAAIDFFVQYIQIIDFF